MRRARRALWAAGAPFRLALLGLIKVYQVTLSGWLGGQCRFYPTCSHYAEEAIRAHGAVRGSLMATWRIARCGPFTAGGVDHPPAPRRGEVREYDSVIQRGAGT
jgi:putative membrane protein insertion efficiency factor